MEKSVFSAEYAALLRALIEARKAAGLRQADVARDLVRAQSFVSKYEHGQRRLDVIEFLKVARVVGLDPIEVLRSIDRDLSR